ncbi:YciI family protein [Rugosimonospora africana]|uniref:YCII-related domain-containing protein n=1 Tax=Rugosimonospora africana TaxID=556532 RepID=A0A8J3QQ86_9ACTN|nr:YciI family protein [Rugosimonospora africana]GIH14509.1 hypothetical protein Raf01_26810 [Rugosimonospora africana]
MKYLLLIYNDPAEFATMPDADRQRIFDDVDVIMKELTESGEMVGGQALAAPSQTKTVRLRGGAVAATDGPFLEAKEHLAGYLIVDVATEERAVEIAGRWPDARYGAMEVREIVHTSGAEG